MSNGYLNTPPPALFAKCYEEAERQLQSGYPLKFVMSHAIRTAYDAGHAARTALAQPAPEGPTDDELDDMANEAGLDLAWRPELRRFARFALARTALAQLTPQTPADGKVVELPPRPPLMEPPAHPALERYGITWDGSPDKPLLTRRADGYWTPWHVAADLLERQQTVPDELTDEELLKAWDAPQYEPLSNNDVLMGLRDVIAADRSRWGRPMPLPSGEVERG